MTEEAGVDRCTDWRINLTEPRQSVVFPGPVRVTGPLEQHAQDMAHAITQRFLGKDDDKRCLLEFGEHRYRVQRVRPNLYAARTLRPAPLRLSELGFPLEYQRLLLSEDLQRTGGLVIFFGATGAGKTTSAASTVVARLENLGGFCLCVEDPPENNLEGFHGLAGYAEQMDASDIGYEQALVEALRCFPAGRPSMLLLGEIRSKDEAYEAMQAALDGHLVITTMHAKDIISGLSRLASLAGAAGEKDTRAMLASGLSLVLHQSLANNSPRISALKFNQIASAIVQNGSFHQLQDEILKQNKGL